MTMDAMVVLLADARLSCGTITLFAGNTSEMLRCIGAKRRLPPAWTVAMPSGTWTGYTQATDQISASG